MRCTVIPDEVKTDEVATQAEAVEEAAHVKKDAPYTYVILDQPKTPYTTGQYAWINDEEAAVQQVSPRGHAQIYMDAPAMEKLVDAWLARHPRAALL